MSSFGPLNICRIHRLPPLIGLPCSSPTTTFNIFLPPGKPCFCISTYFQDLKHCFMETFRYKKLTKRHSWGSLGCSWLVVHKTLWQQTNEEFDPHRPPFMRRKPNVSVDSTLRLTQRHFGCLLLLLLQLLLQAPGTAGDQSRKPPNLQIRKG